MHSNMALSHSRVASIDRRDNASRKSGRPKALTWKEPHRKFVEHDSNTDEASNVPKRQSNRWGLSDAAEHHRVIPSTASVNASLSSSCRRLFENLQEGESQMSSCSSDAEPCRSSLAISLSSASLSSEELVKYVICCYESHCEFAERIEISDRPWQFHQMDEFPPRPSSPDT